MRSFSMRAVSVLMAIVCLDACASTTIIHSDPEGAKLYIDGESCGTTPYTYSDTKIVGSTTHIRLVKDGYEDANVGLQRNEERGDVAFAAAWLQLKGGNESPPAKFADGPSDLGKRAGLLLAIVHGRYQPGADPALDLLVQSLEQRRTISPLAVGLLSAVLPGAGHARLGLWGDALLAFTLNGVAIGTTVELARARLVFPSIAAGLISSLFYAGAIVSASSLVRESNERERSAALAAIERKLFPELPLAGGN